MTRSVSALISVIILALAFALFTVWRPLLDEYGAFIAIGFALLAVFLALAPSRSEPSGDNRSD